ncbi:MAG: DUF4158 domain-containing protein [Pseudonocardiaceae bacterium]
MASIERTAYPRFKRFLSARELHVFYTPKAQEIAWAREVAGTGQHLLAVMVALKAFGRLGYFPGLEEVPAEPSTSSTTNRSPVVAFRDDV